MHQILGSRVICFLVFRPCEQGHRVTRSLSQSHSRCRRETGQWVLFCLTPELAPFSVYPIIWCIAKLIILHDIRKTKCEPGNATLTPIGNLRRTKGNEVRVWVALGLSGSPVARRCLSDRASSRGLRRKGSMEGWLRLILTGKGNMVRLCVESFLFSLNWRILT